MTKIHCSKLTISAVFIEEFKELVRFIQRSDKGTVYIFWTFQPQNSHNAGNLPYKR